LFRLLKLKKNGNLFTQNIKKPTVSEKELDTFINILNDNKNLYRLVEKFLFNSFNKNEIAFYLFNGLENKNKSTFLGRFKRVVSIYKNFINPDNLNKFIRNFNIVKQNNKYLNYKSYKRYNVFFKFSSLKQHIYSDSIIKLNNICFNKNFKRSIVINKNVNYINSIKKLPWNLLKNKNLYLFFDVNQNLKQRRTVTNKTYINQYIPRLVNKNNYESYKFLKNYENLYLFLNDKYYYYLFLKYNLPYLKKVISKIVKESKCFFNIIINTENSINSDNLVFYLKKKLQKRNSQTKLVNPLKLIKSQLEVSQINYNITNDLSSHNNLMFFYKTLKKNIHSIFDFKYIYQKKYILLNELKNSFWNLNQSLFLSKNNNNILNELNNETIIINRFSFDLSKKLSFLKLNKNNTSITYFNLNKNNTNYFFNNKINLLFGNYSKFNNLIYYNSINKPTDFNSQITEIEPLNDTISILKGVKIAGFGRLGSSSKSTRSSITLYRTGKTNLNSLNHFIDYNSDYQITRNGSYGLKVWKFYKNYKNNFHNRIIK